MIESFTLTNGSAAAGASGRARTAAHQFAVHAQSTAQGAAVRARPAAGAAAASRQNGPHKKAAQRKRKKRAVAKKPEEVIPLEADEDTLAQF